MFDQITDAWQKKINFELINPVTHSLIYTHLAIYLLKFYVFERFTTAKLGELVPLGITQVLKDRSREIGL